MENVSILFFPYNLIVILSIFFALFLIKNFSFTQKIWHQLASEKYLLLAVSLFFLSILLIQLIRTFVPDSTDISSFLYRFGFSRFNASPFLLLISLFLFIILTANHLSLWREPFSLQTIRLLIFQIGILLIISAQFLGFFDQERYKMTVYSEYPTSVAIKDEKLFVSMPFEIQLINSLPSYYPSGNLKNVEINYDIRYKNRLYNIKNSVNQPYNFHGYDLYLLAYDQNNGSNPLFCRLFIVKDPWKFIFKIGFITILISSLLMLIPNKERKKGAFSND